MIKKYIYHGDGEALISYDDVEKTITVHKDSSPFDILITKHSTYTTKNGERLARLNHDKAENYIKNFVENVIERGIKDGTCKAV